MRSEALVASVYSEEHQFLFHRLKLFCAEVDLGFVSSSGHVVLIEVKTLKCFDEAFVRIAESQKRRLRNAHLLIQEKLDIPCEFHAAFVGHNNQLVIVKENWLL